MRNNGSLASAATTVTFRQGSPTGPEYAVHIEVDEANLVDEHDAANNTERLVRQPHFTPTVRKAGTGAGRVVGSSSGTDCGSACSARYPVGTTLRLDATPAAGSEFSGWSGACSGTDPWTVTLVAPRSVTATLLCARVPRRQR